MRLGSHMTDEQRAKISAVASNRSPETRAKLSAAHVGKSAWNKGIPMSDTSKAKLSMARIGFRASLETRTKMSLAHFNPSPEIRAKLSAAGMGRVVSDETRAKQREGLNRPEVKAKMSVAGKGRPKSSEWRADMSAREMGPLSNNWKGGITPVNKLIRTSATYATWRTAVFERDHYTCQDCGTRSGVGHKVILEAHHIHEFAQYPDERFVVENGKTLCSECHNKTKGRRLQVVMVGG